MAKHKANAAAGVVGTSRCDVRTAQTTAKTSLSRAPARRGIGEGGFTLPKQRERFSAFTLAELVVSTGVIVLLVLLASQLLNSAATVTTLGHKQMDADSQARQLLDRMAVDFAQMVKRSDVDYYLKSSHPGTPDCTTCTSTQAGNDQIAFFAAASGYYPTPSYQSPVSLVAYRVNSGSSKMERMGKGFVWNGGSPSYIPILFLDSATAPSATILNKWPAAVSSSTTDPDYEVSGPQVFRFEYYYLLKGQVVNGTTYNSIFTDTPWDTRVSGHTNVSRMRDVAAIIADVAVIDAKSRVLLTDAQIATFSAPGDASPHFLVDYSSDMTTPGLLRTQWQNKLNGIIDPNSPYFDPSMPRPAISGIRVYERYFYLNQ